MQDIENVVLKTIEEEYPCMRIAHLSVVRKLTAGQIAQLEAERTARDSIPNVRWDTFALQDVAPQNPFTKQVVWFLRGSPLRNLHGWFEILRLSRIYDFVIVRQMPIDIFAPIFAPWIRNRVSLHHSKEVEEHTLISRSLKRKLAAKLDRVLIRISVSHAIASLGVTNDIAEYERKSYNFDQPVSVYPNLIGDEDIGCIKDNRVPDRTTAMFMCGTFTAWHGLDRLVEAIRRAPPLEKQLKIHLVGKLSMIQSNEILNDPLLSRVFKVHGYLKRDAYQSILEEVDIGIGSLALDRQNMTEGSSLKTAELLGYGIPVYATHRYPTVPQSFPFFNSASYVDVSDILTFGESVKRISREEIVAESEPYIRKRQGMLSVASFLKGLSNTK